MKFTVINQKKRNNNRFRGNPYIKMVDEQLNDELNKFCVECGKEKPEYISINNGIFICQICAKNHLKFPNNISKIIKNNNIKSLTLNEIQPLLCGGNRALLDFINNEFPKLSEFPPHILYRTQAMNYYRQYLQYLINGGIPPVKPSIKYAYKITNFCKKDNNYNNNIFASEKEFYNSIGRSTYNENYELYDNFYQSLNNFCIHNNNNNKLRNNMSNEENKYDNYLINKPSQINFQNNNNIIIGRIEDNYNNNISYSPQSIKIDLKPKNKRTRKNRLNKFDRMNYESMTRLTSNINEVYIRPKLFLSPKHINLFPEYNLSNQTLNNRNKSVDLDKKDYCRTKISFEKGDTNSFGIKNLKGNNYKTINNFLKYKEMSKYLNYDSYNKESNNIIKKNTYIHKSLSQKDFKNNDNQKNDSVQRQTESNICFRKMIRNFNNKKEKIKENEKHQMIQKKNILRNFNSKEDINRNKIINNINKSNSKFSNEETKTFSEYDNLPIKINLKLKIEKRKSNDTKTSCESKKEQIINKNRISLNPKENKKEDVIDEKKNILSKKKPSRMIKNRSQENILKYSNSLKLKTINSKNVNKNGNKFKLKGKK
jgi:hypothetical protein